MLRKGHLLLKEGNKQVIKSSFAYLNIAAWV